MILHAKFFNLVIYHLRESQEKEKSRDFFNFSGEFEIAVLQIFMVEIPEKKNRQIPAT